MAIDQVHQRKRRRVVRVRTGCGTCRYRRIKCDEAKPDCHRCSTTGRKCDGYRSDIPISCQTSKDSTNSDFTKRISVYVPGNTEERRGFDFFLRNTAAELSGYYGSSFWDHLILAASTQKPSLRHAVLAIGALHQSFSRKRVISSTPPTPPTPPAPAAAAAAEEDQNIEFALNQYAKALGTLRRSLSRGKEEPLTALMSCILFVCFDSLRGYFESAMVHLQSGLRILRDMKKSSTRNHIIEDYIAPIFLRLSVQSVIYMESKGIHDRTLFARQLMDISTKEMVISDEFEGLEDARNALIQAANGLFGANYMREADLPAVLQPPESLAIFEKSASQLHLWNILFERFMASRSKDFTNREVRGAALLKIHHTTVKTMPGVCSITSSAKPSFDAMTTHSFCDYSDDFWIIINLSRSLIAATEEDAKNGKPPLTFSSDLGLIGPLYFICINCSVVSIRTAAMELLLRCPRQEGMWNSEMIVQMIQQYWELEARHNEAQEMGMGKLDEYGLPLPFTDYGLVHFTFFGRPEDITCVSPFSPPESVTSPQLWSFDGTK